MMASVPADPKPKPPVAKVIADCRSLKKEDERLGCFSQRGPQIRTLLEKALRRLERRSKSRWEKSALILFKAAKAAAEQAEIPAKTAVPSRKRRAKATHLNRISVRVDADATEAAPPHSHSAPRHSRSASRWLGSSRHSYKGCPVPCSGN